MDFNRELIDKVTREGGVAAIRGWWYDLVLERLEKKGFKRKGPIQPPPESDLEGSVYGDEAGSEVQVVTHRFSATTFIKSTPSPKKPAPQG